MSDKLKSLISYIQYDGFVCSMSGSWNKVGREMSKSPFD